MRIPAAIAAAGRAGWASWAQFPQTIESRTALLGCEPAAQPLSLSHGGAVSSVRFRTGSWLGPRGGRTLLLASARATDPAKPRSLPFLVTVPRTCATYGVCCATGACCCNEVTLDLRHETIAALGRFPTRCNNGGVDDEGDQHSSAYWSERVDVDGYGCVSRSGV